MDAHTTLVPQAAAVVICCVAAVSPAFGFECPEPPQQIERAMHADVERAVADLPQAFGDDTKDAFARAASTVLNEQPSEDRMALASLMITLYCNELQRNAALGNRERIDLMLAFNERVAKVAAGPARDRFLEHPEITYLRVAFSDNDAASARIALGRALESDNSFMQSLALKALFGGKKHTYSGHLIFRGKPVAFMLEIQSFDEFEGTFTGQFVGWKQEFRGQLNGTTLVIIGNRYTFSAELKKGEVMEGDTWDGCMMHTPIVGCAAYEGIVLELF